MKIDGDGINLPGVGFIRTRDGADQFDVRTQPPNIVDVLVSAISGDCFKKNTGVVRQSGIVSHGCFLSRRTESNRIKIGAEYDWYDVSSPEKLAPRAASLMCQWFAKNFHAKM